jgi:sugar phosphate isomerase/epimerase
MNRRKFLVGTAAGAAGLAGLTSRGWAQGGQGAPPAPATPAAGQQGGRGRGGPANVPPEKLARISLMTLNFNPYLKPTREGQVATPDQTLEVFDLPKMYIDMYGVHNIEFQHTHIVKSETDPAFIKELKARIDEQKMLMSQINLEFGQENISTPDAALRQKAIEHVKQWIDIATQYGCPRVMINQQQAQLNKDTKAHAVAAWKTMADYGKSKNVKVSAETRGVVGATEAELGMLPWKFLAGVIEAAGAYSNVDIGNVAAPNQEALHDAIKGLFPTSSGNMHIKSSPNWDIGTAVRFTEGLGYKGLYSIEVSTHPAVRIVYNTILANLK